MTMLNRDIGCMVRRLNVGGRRGGLGGPVMEEGVGQRATDALLQQDEQRGDFDALDREPIGVGSALALE